MSAMFPASQPVHLDYANAVDILNELKLAPKTLTQDCYVSVWIVVDLNTVTTGRAAYLQINGLEVAHAYTWNSGGSFDRYPGHNFIPASKGDTLELIGTEFVNSGYVELIPYK